MVRRVEKPDLPLAGVLERKWPRGGKSPSLLQWEEKIFKQQQAGSKGSSCDVGRKLSEGNSRAALVAPSSEVGLDRALAPPTSYFDTCVV